MTGTPLTISTGGHSTPEEAGTGVTSSAAATGRTLGAMSSPSIRTAVSTRVIAASYGYRPKGAPPTLTLGGRDRFPASALLLAAQRLSELLAVLSRMPRVDRKPIFHRDAAAFAMHAVASQVCIGEVAQYGE